MMMIRPFIDSRFYRSSRLAVTCFAVLLSAGPGLGQDDAAELLSQGDLPGAERVLERRQAAGDLSDADRFTLAVVQYLRAGERFSQAMYAHGAVGGKVTLIPFPSSTGEPQEKAQRISYQQMCAILKQLVGDLDRAEATFAAIDSNDWKAPLDLTRIRLDLDGNGDVDEEETLGELALQNVGIGRGPRDEADTVIAFDMTDVHWFRVNCLLISGLTEFLLAHDWRELWNHTAPYGFTQTDSPYHELLQSTGVGDWEDAVAILHLLKWELTDAEGVGRAGEKCLGTIQQMLATIHSMNAETDNDREWFPNPRQTNRLGLFRTTDDAIERSQAVLEKLELILRGEELFPLARGFMNSKQVTLGVNIQRYLDDPGDFDFILMFQGSAAQPYIEEGKVDYDFWRKMTDLVFQGGLGGFGFGF